MALREELTAVLDGIGPAHSEEYKGHPLAARIRKAWRDSVAGVVDDPSYLVKGSAGQDKWAETVWLAIFDRLVTETAQRGFYVVFLVSRDGGVAYLSLNQGTSEVHAAAGRDYLDVLKRTANRDVGLLASEDLSGLFTGPIALSAKGTYTRGYEAGNIVSVEYRAGALPTEDVLADDLLRLLILYRSLVEGRDQLEIEDEDTGGHKPPKPGLEARRYSWHRRAEGRNGSLAHDAKRIHGTTCQVEACRKDLSAIYGQMANGYIEAHHLTPFAQLDERPTALDPEHDFAVVCPDCHRMIHRRTAEPYTLGEVSAAIEQIAASF